jgi:hypothetical protein
VVKGIEMLHIEFFYCAVIEVQEALPFTKARKTKKRVPTGEGHVFVIRYDGEAEAKSLCGKTKQEIGETKELKGLERDVRIVSLPLCEGCGEAWKNHPESEWSRFVGVPA